MSFLRLAVINTLFSISFSAGSAELLRLPQAIQMALQHRIELQTAKIATESATLALPIVESQLGWQANASAGIKHGLDTFGQTTEQQRITAGFVTQQRSGDQITLQGSYQKDESDVVGATIFPNPVEAYGLILDYRMPLKKGSDNLEYSFAEKQAQAGIATSTAQQQIVVENIVEQVIGIYHRLIDIQIQIQENRHAIERTLKLNEYVRRNSQLGLADRKDRLSVQARLAAQHADEKRLQREWMSQFIELQKLTGNMPEVAGVENFDDISTLPENLEELQKLVTQRDAVIASNLEKLSLAEAQVQLSRDRQKDQLDMVFSIGNETRQGQRSGGALDENEWVGGVRIEYQLPLDRRGVDAKMRQSWIEIDRVRLENQRYMQDLKSLLSQWYQEWQMTADTTQKYLQRKKIEQLRYEEVRDRYQEGRTDIREILDADESLTIAEKLLAREQARRSLLLSLLANRLGHLAKIAEK